MNINYPTWDRVKADYPDFAKALLDEFNRCNGFIPYEPGFIYIIHAVGSDFYKIGKTTNPDRRILQIAPQMPFSTRYVRVWRSMFMSMAEAEMHKLLAEHRTNGEWFKLGIDEISMILCFLTANDIRYSYVSKIGHLLYISTDKPTRRRFYEEFNSILDADTGGAVALSAVEILFQGISDDLLSGQIPSDLKQSVSDYESSFEEA